MIDAVTEMVKSGGFAVLTSNEDEVTVGLVVDAEFEVDLKEGVVTVWARGEGSHAVAFTLTLDGFDKVVKAIEGVRA